jgi:hypothetical protein
VLVLRVLRETGLCCTVLGNGKYGACVNVVFSVTVWRTVSLMRTGTESVKGDRIVLYNFGEQRVCVVCGNVVFCVTV